MVRVSYNVSIFLKLNEFVNKWEEDSARAREIFLFFFFGTKEIIFGYYFYVFDEGKRMAGLFTTLLVLCALNVILIPDTIYARSFPLLR